VRSNAQGRVGFMADGRRLNVALTRARQGMITVGDDLTLRAGSKHWAAYLNWLSAQGAVFGDSTGMVRGYEARRVR
jgi:superfamily I DNA and/or RNA helicase